MSRKKLVLLAHGSSAPRWKKPFEKLAKKLRKTLGKKYVDLIYLDNLNKNLIKISRHAIKSQIQELIISPVLMASGNHTEKDIPKAIKKIKHKFPKLKIKVLKPVGENPEILDAIYKSILKTC